MPPPPGQCTQPRKVGERIAEALQAGLVAIVLLWVFDVPRTLLGVALYGEQVLIVALGLALALAFLLPSRLQWPRGCTWAAAAASIVVTSYLAIRYDSLTEVANLLSPEALVSSALLLLLLLSGTARVAGIGFALLIVALGAYVFVAPHLPGVFQTRPVGLVRLAVYLGLDVNGVFGAVLHVVIFFVVPFTVFGQAVASCGGASFFAELSRAVMSHRRGGAAKIAIVGSLLFGMITGSAVANVLAVGIVTIPMMMRSGFSATRAAAIEAVGSTGGQIAPPVLGAAAFVMAEFLEVPYGAVCAASVVPALLYYAVLYFHVDLEAGRQGIGGVSGEPHRRVRDIVAGGWHFLLPLGFLAVALFKPDLLGLGAGKAALAAAALQLVLSAWRDRLSFAGSARAARDVLRQTGRASVEIIVIGGAAGILVGIVSISGLAFSITLQMVTLAGGNLAVLLVLASALAFVLGMGMPTVSVYILTATLLAPALVKLGVTPMAAHMFVLYTGMLSMITPPVAFAAYAAAQVAGTSGWKTGWDACRVGWGVFVLPFLFVASPSLLLDADPARIAVDVARTLFGLYLVTAGVVGYRARPLSPFARIAYAALGVGALLPAAAFPGAEWVAAASVCLGAGLLFATRPPVPRPARNGSNS